MRRWIAVPVLTLLALVAWLALPTGERTASRSSGDTRAGPAVSRTVEGDSVPDSRAQVRVRVVDDRTEKSISGAQVRFGGARGAAMRTDRRGLVVAPAPESSPIRIACEAQGYVRTEQEIPLESGPYLTVRLRGASSLRASVTCEDEPLEGVRISVESGAGAEDVETEADGSVFVDSLRSEPAVAVRFRKPGFLPVERTVNLAGAKRVDVSLVRVETVEVALTLPGLGKSLARRPFSVALKANGRFIYTGSVYFRGGWGRVLTARSGASEIVAWLRLPTGRRIEAQAAVTEEDGAWRAHVVFPSVPFHAVRFEDADGRALAGREVYLFFDSRFHQLGTDEAGVAMLPDDPRLHESSLIFWGAAGVSRPVDLDNLHPKTVRLGDFGSRVEVRAKARSDLESVSVTSWWPGAAPMRGVAVDGKATIALPAGKYRVFYLDVPLRDEWIEVGEGETEIVDLDAELMRQGSIVGRTSSPVRLILWRLHGRSRTETGETEADEGGAFAFPDLSPGEYLVAAEFAGGRVSRRARVKGGQAANVGLLEESELAEIWMRFLDTDNTPRRGLSVEIGGSPSALNHAVKVETDADGVIRVPLARSPIMTVSFQRRLGVLDWPAAAAGAEVRVFRNRSERSVRLASGNPAAQVLCVHRESGILWFASLRARVGNEYDLPALKGNLILRCAFMNGPLRYMSVRGKSASATPEPLDAVEIPRSQLPASTRFRVRELRVLGQDISTLGWNHVLKVDPDGSLRIPMPPASVFRVESMDGPWSTEARSR